MSSLFNTLRTFWDSVPDGPKPMASLPIEEQRKFWRKWREKYGQDAAFPAEWNVPSDFDPKDDTQP